MTIETVALARAFSYNGAKLLDPGTALTPDQVRDFYTNVYPDLANAEVEGPVEKDGVQQYTFRRAVGTKGGYGTDGLTFNTLRDANLARLPEFKNRHGRPAHSKNDGSDWTPAQWLQAVIGELGEFANIRKKYERGDLTFDEYEIEARRELADVQTYLDLLALRALDSRVGATHPTGINLGEATIEKFNEVSKRVGSRVRLSADDWHYVDEGRG